MGLRQRIQIGSYWATPAAVLTVILVVALLVRLVMAAVLPDQGATLPDIATYRSAAHQLATDWLMTDTTKMPLYPLLIALTGDGYGQLAADLALSVVMVGLIYALTWSLFADRHAAAAAALVSACYLPFAFFAVVGLSETLFITLMLGAFVGWYRRAFFAASICAVLAVLTRPIFDLAAPMLIVLFAMGVHRLSMTETAKKLLAYAAVYVTLMAPWWVHNYRLYNGFVRLNPNLGWVLYAGNNPLNQSGGGNGGTDYKLSRFKGIEDPLLRDRAMRDAALAYIASDPIHFLKMAGLKFVRIWRLWPQNASYSHPLAIVVSILSIVPVLLLAMVGLILSRREWRRMLPILLFGISYTLLHMILVGTIRYRLPLEPFLICFSGAAVSALVRTAAAAWTDPRLANGHGA